MVHERHPRVAETMVVALEANEEFSSIQAVLRCARFSKMHGSRGQFGQICKRAVHQGAPATIKTHVNHVWDGNRKQEAPSNSTTTITWSGPG